MQQRLSSSVVSYVAMHDVVVCFAWLQLRMQFLAENRSSRIVEALKRDIGASEKV